MFRVFSSRYPLNRELATPSPHPPRRPGIFSKSHRPCIKELHNFFILPSYFQHISQFFSLYLSNFLSLRVCAGGGERKAGYETCFYFRVCDRNYSSMDISLGKARGWGEGWQGGGYNERVMISASVEGFDEFEGYADCWYTSAEWAEWEECSQAREGMLPKLNVFPSLWGVYFHWYVIPDLAIVGFEAEVWIMFRIDILEKFELTLVMIGMIKCNDRVPFVCFSNHNIMVIPNRLKEGGWGMLLLGLMYRCWYCEDGVGQLAY